MSLATIIKKIEGEAEESRQKLLAKARAEGEQILAHGRAEAEKEAAQILRHAEDDLHNQKNKQMATTVLQARKEKLDNRQRILDEVFAKALARILGVNPEQYLQILKNILLSVEEDRPGTIIPAQGDKALITRAVIDEINAELSKRKRKLQFTLSSKTAEIHRCVILDFGDFEMNYAVEKVLSSLWTEIKGEVSKRLFESEG
jgi:V/A-type H+-transporting ATPase subunit E